MGKPVFLRLFIHFVFLCLFPAGVFAVVPYPHKNVVLSDSAHVQKQDDQKQNDKEQKKPVQKQGNDAKPDIKQVAKARRQPKPVVIKPIIKIKQIKVIRPKIRKP